MSDPFRNFPDEPGDNHSTTEPDTTGPEDGRSEDAVQAPEEHLDADEAGLDADVDHLDAGDEMESGGSLTAPDDFAAPEAPVASSEAGLPAAPVTEAAPEGAPAAASPYAHPIDDPAMQWYIIHTYSGFERKVKESLTTRSQAFGFQEKIGQVLIPKEEVVELKNGKKVTSERLLYPGYVMVQMAMDDELWHHIKETPRVTGFVGGGNTPVPLSQQEVHNILHRETAVGERPRPKQTYERNETVRIVDGPFSNFSGKVDEVNLERGTLRVMVTIFGRATPVELEFLQVEKM